MRRSDPSLRWWFAAVALALVLAVDDDVPAQQIVPGTNVNIVSGTTLPDGDPYLQRQNEPSSAVSTSNPLHILAGVNDYRTVDIPHPSDLLRPQRMNADAWVGIFKSLDGGQNWKSTLLPGYPQDPAHTAPLFGYDAATDPFMRAGTNGLFYFAGVAFDRGDNAPSAIFVARYKDMNNLEAGDPIVHLDTRIADSDPGGRFLDKVALATDIPRTAATCSFNVPLGDAAGTVVPQTIPAGNVYVAYAAFTGSGATEQSAILFTRSTNCGATWGAPRNLSTGSRLVQNPQIAVSPNNGHIYVSWRRFRSSTQDDSMFVVKSIDGGATFGKPVRVAGLRPFDQPTTLTSFRTNGFQTMAIDGTGRVYLAWSDRGYATQRPDPLVGDARVVISTSTTGATWTVPRPVDTSALGHQAMPALTFHAGKLRLLYYDLREDVSSIFAPFVDDLDIVTANSAVRHTLDVFVAQALPGPTPVFTTARLSDYAFGFIPGADDPQRLQFNPPNLPLFRQGTTPFMGDYIDLAPAPAYLQNPDGSWSHNTAASNAISHAFWTDNRDVRPPADGDWANYTAVGTVAGQPSHYDSTQTLPGCSPGQAGMRNQNVYTARVTEGLFVSAPGNNKPFDDFQRAFVVVAENATSLIRTFRLTIENQPIGGQASFLQFSPLPTLDVTIPPFSSMARTVFASSTDENARINVSIIEVSAPGGVPVAGGLSGTVVLNPDPQAPRLQNPRLQNPRLQNPLISEAEVYAANITNAVFAVPRLQNPRLQNPTIENPRLQNDSLGNPRLQNDAVANPGVVSVNPTNTTVEAPRLQNPRLQNPRLQNESLVNAAFADSSWSLTNDGNTTAAYTVNLVLNEPIPAGFGSQLLIHKTTTVPAANGCTLAEQLQTVLVANIPDPEFVPLSDVANPRLQNPRLQNPTLALAPGESATLTLRIVDLNRFDGTVYDASGAVTPAVVAQSVNTEDVAAGSTTPPVTIPLTIATTALAPIAPGAPYSRSLQTIAGAGALTCSVISGTLPPGLSLSPGGTIAGTPTTPGNYQFTVRCVDANGNEDDQPLFLQIDPTTPTGFDAVWNGLDTDWSNPDNWSPRGVPDPTDRVYISAAIPTIATLTRDVTVRDLFVEPGATVNTNGFNLTITGNADAGRTIIGTGTTILTGDGVSATGVFSNLEIRGRIILSGALTTTGRLTLGAGARLSLNGQSLIVGGQLASNVTAGAAPLISGPASTFIVSGLAVNGLVIQSAPLTVNGGTLTQFDNVSFAGFAPEAIQLTINHPGLPASFTLLGLSFSTNPTTGRLILANDTLADANVLVLDVMGAVPADGSADTQTLGGALVNWVFNPGEANLAVVQSVSPVPAVAGTPLTYTIRVTNGGPAAATGVTLNPGVPAGATGVVATATQGTCALVAGSWSCALGTIPAGGEAVATVTFVPAGAGVLVTTASVTAAQADSVPANNSHVLAATIVPAGAGVNLSIAKTDTPDPVAAGGAFSYSIVVTNAGTTVATGVRVVDVLPAGITAGVPTTTLGACSIAGGQVQCNIGTLNPGQNATITLPATAGAAGLVSNTAVVTSNEVELTPGNNLATTQTMVATTVGCSVATFSGPVSFAGSPGPTAVVRLVDMDHDGDLDAVGTHEINTGGVDVWLNNGTGQFAAPRFTSTQTGPWIHVVADFNGDTHPDVISSSDRTAFGNPITLRLLTNDGTGTLTLVPTFSIPFGGHLDALDFDLDGDQDLVIVTQTGDLALLRNGGTANFAAPVTILPAPIGGFPTFGDFNGDNRTDAAIALGTAGYVVVLADATGGFLPPVAHAVAGGAHGVTSADFNEDGDLDLVIVEGDDEPALQTSIALGDGAGGFGAAVEVVSGAFVYAPTFTDFNGDGHLDLLAISGFNTFAVRLGNGAGGFATPVEYANASYYWPTAGDVNGDGRPDIVTGDRTGQLNVFLNNCGAAATNLSVAVVDSPDPVNEGDVVTYTATVTNQTANPATGVTLRSVLSPDTGDDPEEPNVSVIAITSSAAGATLATSRSTYTWTLPTLAGNSTATFQFQFRALGGATLLFTSGATSDGAETDPSDNTATASTTVAGVGRTIEVTTTADSGPGSLRQAINESNGDAGDTDHIVFNIQPAGPKTITVLNGGLPSITQPVTIDGTTQPGFTAAPIVELNGNGVATNGLTIETSNTTVRGLVINRFGMSGIFVTTAGGGNVIEGNYIGLNAAGTGALANNSGVVILSAGNRVGGTTAAARNIISGNTTTGIVLPNPTATANLVQGNYIGLNAGGTAAVPNQGVQSGINITNGASNNTVLGNVVSGNTQHAVTVFGATTNANVIQGNFIGTDPTGLIRLANGGIGVDVVSASNTVVGGAGAARNIISGNGTGMQLRTGAVGTLVQNNYIGVAASGTAAISNNLVGISINDGAGANIIGGATAGLRNLISGNTGAGISLAGTLTTDNVIIGNSIGAGATTATQLPNQNNGITINGATDTRIGGPAVGEGNIIAFNTGHGVNVIAGTGNRISNNAISDNGLIGINLGAGGVTANDAGDADLGANNLQNFPVLTLAVDNGATLTVQGTLNSLANTTFRIEIFGNAAADVSGFGEGATPLGFVNVTTDGAGNAAFSTTVPDSGGTVLSATAEFDGNTSEFSAVQTVTAAPPSFVVINTNDTGAGSLRQAIIDSNATPGVTDTISFNIPGGGVHTITPTIALPAILSPAIIDATTQPGYSGAPLIELNGVAIEALGTNGLNVTGGNTTIRGLAINRFTGNAIAISTGGGNIVEANYLGTNAAGALASPNGGRGVFINGSSANRVGGLTAAQRNVISGNAIDGVAITGAASVGNLIQGNYIGTNAAGSAAIPNQFHGVFISNATGSVVGGPQAGAGNVLSGNSSNGVGIFESGATFNTVEGNVVGLNAGLTAPVANGIDGIGIVRAPNNIIRNNTVAGNGRMGVGLFESTATGNLVEANRIGTIAVLTDFGNAGDGVHISFTASNNTIGGGPIAGNVIAFNAGRGINVVSGTNNRLTGNRIFDNDLIGIDLANNGVTPNDAGDGDAGANNLQNFPVLTSAIRNGTVVTVQGTLNSSANTTFEVEIFSGAADPTGFGEGMTRVVGLSVTTNGSGSATFSTEVLTLVNTFTATATDPNGNTSEFSAAVTVTSEPEDATIAVTDATAAELGGDTATFVISRPAGEPTTSAHPVTASVTGTAVNLTDYTISAPGLTNFLDTFTVSIPAGQTSVSVTVTPIFDPAAEPAETVIFTVEGTTASATIADEPLVTIAATDATGAELGPDAATFLISRGAGASSTYARLVTASVTGTAVNLTDYTISAPGLTNFLDTFTVNIPAGQTSVSVTVTPIFDPAAEPAETVIFTVEGTTASATIADEPLVTIAATDATGAELGPDAATFLISRGAGASSTYARLVTASVTGTAVNLTDYTISAPGLTNFLDTFTVNIPAGQTSVSVTVTPIFDPAAEPAETVIFTVEGTTASATIADEPLVTIAATDATGAELGPDAATFLISRGAGASSTYARPVTASVTGTAVNLTDYTISAPGLTNFLDTFTVNIPAGQISVTVNVTPIGDPTAEGPETVIFTVEGTTASATIADTPVSTQRVWISDVDGAWDNPANWSGGAVPQPGDTVVIDRPTSITVTLTTAASIASLTSQERLTIAGGSLTSSGLMALSGGLTISSGQIAGAGDLTLGGTSLWTGGQIAGTGSMTVNAGATLTVNSPGSAGVLGRNLFNSGTVIWNQESLSLSGLTITNNVDGVFEIQTNLPISDGGFNNAGRLFKSGPVGPITLSNVQFNTTGSLDLRIAGATEFDAIQSNGAGSLNGTLNVALQGGFVPSAGTAFNVLTFGVRTSNTFSTINGNGQEYTPNYTATGLTLVAQQDSIVLSLVDTTLVGVGRQAVLRVTLPFAAPAGGVTATVSSGNTNLLTVVAPGTIAFAQGQTIGEILVNGVQAGNATVTVTAPGYLAGELSVSVTQNLISTPLSLNVPFGQSVALPINIGPSPAPPGGLTLSVVSANPAAVEVLTPQVTITEGALSANATVRGAQIGGSLLTVSNPSYSPSTTNVTSSAELNIVQASATVHIELPAPALTVRLESSGTPIAAQQAITVNLASANPACVAVAATSTIPNGQVTTSFTPAYGGTAPLPCTTTVTASATGLVSDSISITVNPQTNITASAAVIVGSRLMIGTSATLGTMQHGGVTVTVTSSDPTRVLLSRNSSLVGQASITIPMLDGQSFVPYVVHGVENTTGSATVTLSSPGFIGDSHLVTVSAIGVEIHELDPTMSVIGGEDNNLYVQVGIPNAQGTALASVQQVRAGSPLVVTLTNSNSVVGQLRSDEPALTAQMVTKPIQPGIYFSLANGAGTAWGLAFQPLAGGNTTVTATGPPGVVTMTTTGVRQVVVSGSGSITPPGTIVVGSRLMTSTAVSLSAANHGGVTATVTSSNPAMALVSADGQTVGTTSANVVVPNGQTFVPYFVHGAANVTGTATFTVSVPSFGSVNHQVDVVASGVEIHGLDTPTSIQALEDIDWYVQVGIPNAGNTALAQIQFVRPGAPLVITLTNSDDAVGVLRSDEPVATGQTVTKPIQPGIYFSTAVQAGTSWGLGFEALANGFTNVTATGPAGVLTMSQTGVRRVDVQDTGITPPGTTVVGARLMTPTGATLGAAGHGGIDVTVTSSDPTRVRVSADAVTVGTASTIVTVPNGQPFVTYYLHGGANTTGPATITIVAPGFGQAQHEVQVVAAGVEILQLEPLMSNLSAEDVDWYVQVGIPNATGTSLAQVQFVQPGAPLVVTLTNSNATVGRLRSDEPPLIAQSVTKPIQPGIYFTLAAVAGTSWGLAFDPLANGTTTVTVSGPAGVQTMSTTGVRTVVVGTPAILVPETEVVGAGLETPVFAQLTGSQHGGINVLITSSAPGLVRIAPDGAAVGDPDGSISIPVADNQASLSFYLQALENVTGTATVTLSAPGFTTSTITVTVTAAGIEIVGLPTPVQAGAGEDVNWYVQAGVPNQFGGLSAFQPVRPGSPGFVITLTSSSNAASLRSDQPAASGQSVTKPIPAGFYFTQAVAAGTSWGLGFTAVSSGTVTISATGPAGVIATPNASRIIVINP